MGYLLPLICDEPAPKWDIWRISLEPWITAWEGGSVGALAGVVCIGQVRCEPGFRLAFV